MSSINNILYIPTNSMYIYDLIDVNETLRNIKYYVYSNRFLLIDLQNLKQNIIEMYDLYNSKNEQKIDLYSPFIPKYYDLFSRMFKKNIFTKHKKLWKLKL